MLLGGVRSKGQELEQEAAQEAVNRRPVHLAEAVMEHHLAAWEVERGGRLEGANRVLVAGRLCPWIFYHVADPMYAPHPKGWETTLEPYRSLELLIYDS